MMIPARNHWAAQSRNSGNRGTSLFEVGEVMLIVDTAYLALLSGWGGGIPGWGREGRVGRG